MKTTFAGSEGPRPDPEIRDLVLPHPAMKMTRLAGVTDEEEPIEKRVVSDARWGQTRRIMGYSGIRFSS